MENIKVNEIEISYEITGDGPVVVFLHAFAVTNAMWTPQVPVFSQSGYKVVTVNLRGHGFTSAPQGPYTLPKLANDIHSLINK